MGEDSLKAFILAGFHLFFMDSEDDDDDGDDNDDDSDEEMSLIELYAYSHLLKTRRKRQRTPLKSYISRYSLTDFQSHFRISRQSFEILMPFLIREKKNFGRPPVPEEKQLLICLWVLGNQECLRSIADRFDNDKSTIRACTLRVCNILVKNISQFITWPNTYEMTLEAKLIETNTQFPGVFGVIGGTHISISKVHVHDDSYINKKGYPSVHLQAVCNSKCQFIHVYCGPPGNVDNEEVLRMSDLPEKLALIPEDKHLLGDSTYPLSRSIITPYRDNGRLSNRQKKFNRIHSSIRINIEQAFKILRQKFRCLKGLHMGRIDLIPNLVVACCVLHNVSIDDDFECVDSTEDEAKLTEIELSEVCDEVFYDGMAKRNILLEHINLISKKTVAM